MADRFFVPICVFLLIIGGLASGAVSGTSSSDVVGAAKMLLDWRVWALFIGAVLCLLFFLRVSLPAISRSNQQSAEREAHEKNKFNHADFMNEEKKVGVEINHKRLMGAFRSDQRMQEEQERKKFGGG